ncbi:hypothetical protein INT43_007362 [Umbelopsis isabellina]|uniref:DNA 5'-3' helicase n=1 Tax=Mortierella isabellina TaxID=91625 RepID=A0A8H7PY63_MORIS|nr:hypothetical protein INT43_007362 [Umbelopsis isabellina]
MTGRGRIPPAFLAKLEEKKRKATEDFISINVEDHVESATPNLQNTFSEPVEYEAKLSGKTVLPIRGIEVQFPYKPYPAQIQMMAKVIEGLTRSQDALIESPTGSGKSLALLCATLAWQKHEQMAGARTATSTVVETTVKFDDDIQALTKEEAKKVWNLNDSPSNEPVSATQDEFQPMKPSKMQRKRPRYFEDLDPTSKESEVEMEERSSKVDTTSMPYMPRATRIYYATRTHKQISQVVAELKSKTSYRPKMTILGSRDQLCIHPKVSKAANKQEECSILMDDGRCSYGNNVRRIVAHSSIQRGGSHFIWDIEDLAKIGRRTHGCPYYAAKTQLEVAEIIFCPYNYLIEPLIREAFEINLKDSVVILDEAHNIEDTAREASSFEIHEKELMSIQKELIFLIKYFILVEPHRKLLFIVESLMGWIVDPDNVFSPLQYEHYTNSWTGLQLVKKLNGLGINKFTWKNDLYPALRIVQAAANQIRKDKATQSEAEHLEIAYEDEDIQEIQPSKLPKSKRCLSVKSERLLEGLFVVLHNLFDENNDHTEDYVMVLMKRVHKNRATFDKQHDWEFKLSFWCHNAGLAFREIAEVARSVILCSGTLSPMNGFATELQTDFPIRLETNHVIDQSQMWAGVIPFGPEQVTLSGTFKTLDTYVYQDDIGAALLRIANIIPNGMLCFVPSYSALNKFLSRWKTTGLYTTLSQTKTIVIEPQNMPKGTFEKELSRFYAAAHAENSESNGAILFGVYRGKISEGIDFSDSRCRAVISIGIPFPHLKDFKVISKRDYNSAACSRGRSSINGSEWYSIQAHRAVNQALGRCIRHKKDWGAIILLEHRYLQKDNLLSLSKWIRSRCGQYPDFDEAMSQLTAFVNHRQLIDDQENTEYQVQAAVNLQPDVNSQVAFVKGVTIGPTDAEEVRYEEKIAKEMADIKEGCNASPSPSASPTDTMSDAMEGLQEVEEDFLDLTQPSLSVPSQDGEFLASCADTLKDMEYIILCRQCLMELGHCIQTPNFAIPQRTTESQFFDNIRPLRLPDTPCIVYELLPNEDWHSDLFRIEPLATQPVIWSPTDRVCYREIHCPTCQSEVPNGLGSSIIGGTIAVCESGSPEQITALLGRHWLLQEAVKIGSRTDLLEHSPSKKVKLEVLSQGDIYQHHIH